MKTSTWQEISSLDLPASVDYVLKNTGQSGLYYIGHSQGTVVMFAKLAEDPDFSNKIRQFHALAPVATVSHIGGLYHIFGHYLMDFADFLLHRIPNTPLVIPKILRKIIEFFCSLPVAQGVCTLDIGFIDGREKMINNFLLHRIPNTPLVIPKILRKIIEFFCSLPVAQGVCTLDIGFIDGREKMINNSRIGLYLCHMPAATSSKNLLHWVQVRHTRDQINQSINEPGYFRWETILAEMNSTIRGNYELPHYTHLDFVFGLNATVDLYQPIIKEIRDDYSRILMLQDNRVHT
ncbi:hypothetical protein OESDEN_06610 [Oesophagostomum dentatum]|uniref:AB hydrolase-1 domain-containing protein n=1 Tax=Oesophagostomum dentatum TaxID=61180 RepID=A0A0B1TBE4_OESDE|nr:hypothetical protein OESDEN_06610 [Oesophagostomum dentatum]